MTLRTALIQGTQLLEEGGIAVPRLSAEVLLGFALRRDRSYLYAHPEEELSEVGWIHFGRYLNERLSGKPPQYITHVQEFYGRSFRVSPAVLIPRPETEHLVEEALRRVDAGARVVDVGCGSGAIGVTLAIERGVRACLSDISAPALAVARSNSEALGARVDFVQCDLLAAFEARSLDAVVSNPPYVPETGKASLQREVRDWEPHIALFGGPSGMEVYQRLAGEAERVLRPGGWLLLELGYNLEERVREMLGAAWETVATTADLAGIPRVISARKKP